MKNLVPLALLIGGVCAALCYVYLAFTQPERAVAVQFAIACLCAAIGWKELGE